MMSGHCLIPVSGMTTLGYISVTIELWWVRQYHNAEPEIVVHYLNGAWDRRLNSLEKAVLFDMAEQRLLKRLILQLAKTPDTERAVVNG